MSEPEKGWQPPPVGENALEAACKFSLEPQHNWRLRLRDLLDAYAAPRVAEARSDIAAISMNAHRWMQCHDQVVGWIRGRPDLLKEFIENGPRYSFPNPNDLPNAIAEARAQERRLYDEALDDAFFWLTSRNAKESDRVACADRIRRALAEPQEQT